MDTAIQTLLGWQFIMLCLVIAAITLFIRKYVDFIINKYNFTKIKYTWEELLLPTMPILLGGCLAAVAKQYPFPETITTLSGRVFFGIVAGMLSGFVYRVVKSFLMNQIKSTSEEAPKDNLEETK